MWFIGKDVPSLSLLYHYDCVLFVTSVDVKIVPSGEGLAIIVGCTVDAIDRPIEGA